MDIAWIRIVSQCGVYATFAVYLIWIWAARRGAAAWAPLLGAVAYAVVFEHLNMLRYASVQGGYHYHAQSWFWIWGDVPLYIPLAWAFILATSRTITDHLGLRSWARPFSDALLALLIDLSMDAVAIRLRFWTWHGVRLNEAFFGVPADNFLGWLLVSFTFCALTRALWSSANPGQGSAGRPGRSALSTAARVGIQWLAVPPAAYVCYLAIEAGVHRLYALASADTLQRQLYVLAGVIGLFGALTAAGYNWKGAAPPPPTGRLRKEPWLAVHGPRHIFHLFGLTGLLFVPTALRTGGLWALAVGVWCAEWTLAILVSSRRARPAETEVERNVNCPEPAEI